MLCQKRVSRAATSNYIAQYVCDVIHRMQRYPRCRNPMMPLSWLAGLYLIFPCSVRWGFNLHICFHPNKPRAQSNTIICYNDTTRPCPIKKRSTHLCHHVRNLYQAVTVNNDNMDKYNSRKNNSGIIIRNITPVLQYHSKICFDWLIKFEVRQCIHTLVN